MRFPVSHVFRVASLVVILTFIVSYLLIKYNGHLTAHIFPISLMGIRSPEAISYKIGHTITAFIILGIVVVSRVLLQGWIRRIMKPQFALLCFGVFVTGIMIPVGMLLHLLFSLPSTNLYIFTEELKDYPVPPLTFTSRTHQFGAILFFIGVLSNTALFSLTLSWIKDHAHFREHYPVTRESLLHKKIVMIGGICSVVVSLLFHPTTIPHFMVLGSLAQWVAIASFASLLYSYGKDCDKWNLFFDITRARVTLNNSNRMIGVFKFSVDSIPVIGKIIKTRRLVNQLRGVQFG